MFGSTNGLSLADIAAVTKNNNDGDGFGAGNGWWVLIILFALFGGWGNNGYGNRGNECSSGSGSDSWLPYYVMSASNNGVQSGFNNAEVLGSLRGIEQGICSLGYDQLNQMNGINNNILQTGFGIQNAIQANAIANMQNTNALSRQLSDCCCENRQSIAQVRYDMATDTCAITTAINQAAQNIIQNDNANYRQLHDEQVAIQMQAKDDKIAEQASLIQALNLAQSQSNQNQYLLNQLRPPVVPCVPANEYYGYGFYGNNGGCGQCNRAC